MGFGTLVFPANVFFVLVFSSCAAMSTLVENAGRLADGTTTEFKTNEHWQSIDGTGVDIRVGRERYSQADSFVFRSRALPNYIFYASIPDAAGNFFITKLHFLSGNYGGWNEYTADAGGRGRFSEFDGEYNAAFTVIGTIERHDIIEGKIRRETTRLFGDRSREALRNRDERIKALVSWMREYVAGAGQGIDFANQQKFEMYWRPLLLPKNKREAKNAPKIPSALENARMEGALAADWNEALPWIYLEYDFKKITAVLNNEAILTRIK
jgi:hypothetical protein